MEAFWGKNDFSLLLFLFYFVVVLQERFHCINKSASTPGLNDIISGRLLQVSFFVATKVCLPRQNFCRDKCFRENFFFVATKLYFRRDKHTFVATKDVFLSRQNYVCRKQKKSFVATNTCL